MFDGTFMNEQKLQQWFNKRKEIKQKYDFNTLFNEIKSGDLTALSKGITLLESTLESDQKQAQELIQMSLPFIGNSIRIGITGVPGVGKSTFIESFGLHLINKGYRVAVLAIDPSSERSSGSILGDKTRMNNLSQHPKAFIRPSPAGDSLGGVARKTRESTYLCELAGFNIILIETVGVGQSETAVHSMVDFFLLLMLAGAGDELQGIKRGIMEMADLLVVTKADSDNLNPAKKAMQEYKNAMHLFPQNENNWIPKACISSIYLPETIEHILSVVEDFKKQMEANNFIIRNRKKQDIYWFEETLKELILYHYYHQANFKKQLEELKKFVLQGKISSFEAANLLFLDQLKANGENKL